ncbi:MAG: hypothetical protein KAR16_09350 [Bacteroidales bacterium]|nr:hypothetical protein [Bacteroidales bacterium]
MRIFRFEKWFVDVLTLDRDYIIFFHTLLEVLGIRVCFVEVNISRFGEGHNFHLNRKLKVIKRSGHTISTRQGHILYEEEMGKIMLLLRGMEIELNINPVHPSDFIRLGMKIRKRGNGYLEWKPLYLKAMVEGRIRIEGEREQVMDEEKITGTGYADYLYSTMSPFRVPVRQLYWGRLHSQDLDLTFSYALGAHDEVTGAQMMVQAGGETIRLDKISVHADRWEEFISPGITCPASYMIKASSQRMQLALKVVHLKPAIVSEFMENLKELGRLGLAILRRISREPRGIKFYSSACLEFVLDGQTRKLDEVFMIDEYVKFT